MGWPISLPALILLGWAMAGLLWWDRRKRVIIDPLVPWTMAGMALVVVAMGLLLVGVAAHVRVWLKSAPKGKVAFSRGALKQTISDVFLGLRVLKSEVPAGIMHALIFWGFVILTIGTTILVIHEHLTSFLAGKSHLLFEISIHHLFSQVHQKKPGHR